MALRYFTYLTLYLCPQKCDFEKTKIEYLRLIISCGKVEMDPVKVSGIMDWPTPANWKEVQAFLGFTNFYHQFIEGFSHHMQPLFKLMKKDVKWSWGDREQQALMA